MFGALEELILCFTGGRILFFPLGSDQMTSLGGTYWCHQCNQTVRPTSGDELICPTCNEGFLEEIDNAGGGGGGGRSDFQGPGGVHQMFGFGGGDVDLGERADAPGGVAAEFRRFQAEPRGIRFPGRMSGHPAVIQVLEVMSHMLQQIQPSQGGQESGEADTTGDESRARGRGGVAEDGPGEFNPMLMLQGQMQNFLGGGGNVEVFFDNGTGIPRRLPGNFGDYFLGPGLDQLIQQLAENDPSRHGAPPASKSAVEAMPTIQISQEHLGTDAMQCAVCKDEFELGASVRQMPCMHMYHADCILPWLAQHNSCPVCRYEMPTDEQVYDQSRSNSTPAASTTANPNSGGNGAGVDGGGTSGGFTFWGPPASFGTFPSEQTSSGGSRDSGSSAPTSGSGSGVQASSAPAPAPTPGSGGGIGRRMSFHLPWFRSSTHSPATAPASGSSGAGGDGGGGGNQGSGSRRNAGDGHMEPHSELD